MGSSTIDFEITKFSKRLSNSNSFRINSTFRTYILVYNEKQTKRINLRVNEEEDLSFQIENWRVVSMPSKDYMLVYWCGNIPIQVCIEIDYYLPYSLLFNTSYIVKGDFPSYLKNVRISKHGIPFTQRPVLIT